MLNEFDQWLEVNYLGKKREKTAGIGMKPSGSNALLPVEKIDNGNRQSATVVMQMTLL
jgi:hypothetical protein